MNGIVFDFERGDVCVENGALKVSIVDEQVAQMALTAFRGEFKEVPLIGGEVKMLLGGCVDVMWPGRMKRMLKVCGIMVSKISFVDGIIVIER